MLWYGKKFFYVSISISLFILVCILGFTEYGYTKYSDRLITIDMSQEDLQRSLKLLYATDKLRDSTLNVLLQEYSPIAITAITFASADKSLGGHNGRVVSYMFAEDAEIMVFLLLLRIRREIFALQIRLSPKTLPSGP